MQRSYGGLPFLRVDAGGKQPLVEMIKDATHSGRLTRKRAHSYRISCPLNLTLALDIEPPSSYKARAYFIRFARVHDCFDQLIYTFAAALTIPAHIRFGASNYASQSQQRRTDDSAMAIPNVKPRLGQYPSILALAGVTPISFRKITVSV